MAKKQQTFVEFTTALIKGEEDPTVKALKIQKQMEMGLKTQISIRQGIILDLEYTLEDLEEKSRQKLANDGKDVVNKDDAIRAYLGVLDDIQETTRKLNFEKQTLEWLQDALTKVES